LCDGRANVGSTVGGRATAQVVVGWSSGQTSAAFGPCDEKVIGLETRIGLNPEGKMTRFLSFVSLKSDHKQLYIWQQEF
jgi:hypothetical protein